MEGCKIMAFGAGPSNYVKNSRWHQSGKYPYESVMGGDGMQVAIDTRNNNIIYTGYQFGNYFRVNRKEENANILPLNINWVKDLIVGIGNLLFTFLSTTKMSSILVLTTSTAPLIGGDHFEKLSKDLTQGGRKGNVPYGTLTTVHESPLKFGLPIRGFG